MSPKRVATQTHRAQKLRYYRRRSRARNGGKEWTKRDDELVLAHVVTDTELSKHLGRSVRAIQVRRSRLVAREVEGWEGREV